MANGEAYSGKMHCAAWVRTGDDSPVSGGSSPCERRQFAITDVGGQFGLQRRVCAAGAAAQAVIVKLHEVGDHAEHGAHRLLRSLHMAKVTRVLDDHCANPSRRMEIFDVLCDELVNVANS